MLYLGMLCESLCQACTPSSSRCRCLALIFTYGHEIHFGVWFLFRIRHRFLVSVMHGVSIDSTLQRWYLDNWSVSIWWPRVQCCSYCYPDAFVWRFLVLGCLRGLEDLGYPLWAGSTSESWNMFHPRAMPRHRAPCSALWALYRTMCLRPSWRWYFCWITTNRPLTISVLPPYAVYALENGFWSMTFKGSYRKRHIL